MAFIPLPLTVEVCIVFSGGPKPQRVCFNVTSAVAWTIATMQALASDIVDAIVNDGLSWMSSSGAAASLHLTDVSSASGPVFDWLLGSGSNTLPKSGTGAVGITASQAALVTTLRTTARGRSFRGRNYWPLLADSIIGNDGATVNTTRVNGQQTFVSSLIAAIHANPQRTLVVASKHNGGVPRVTGVTTPVTSFDTNNRVDTQRRRVQP